MCIRDRHRLVPVRGVGDRGEVTEGVRRAVGQEAEGEVRGRRQQQWCRTPGQHPAHHLPRERRAAHDDRVHERHEQVRAVTRGAVPGRHQRGPGRDEVSHGHPDGDREGRGEEAGERAAYGCLQQVAGTAPAFPAALPTARGEREGDAQQGRRGVHLVPGLRPAALPALRRFGEGDEQGEEYGGTGERGEAANEVGAQGVGGPVRLLGPLRPLGQEGHRAVASARGEDSRWARRAAV